ncbi:hypothetical protein SI35_24440 [Salmonella enterica]|nr:hypothetical protein [Salmonella enterica]EGG4135087.1 hypothetical protein [Salmonella enterica]
MKLNGWKGDPIDVVRMADGKLTTVDNTRVLAASRAGVKVEARVHDVGKDHVKCIFCTNESAFFV